MKNPVRLRHLLSLLLLSALVLACGKQEAKFPYRWVYASSGLRDQDQLNDVKQVVLTAAEHGVNGILLSAGIDAIELRDQSYLDNLKELKRYCDSLGVEIIPSVFSTGYGGTFKAFNPNLAEGLPVRDARFVVKGAQATLVQDHETGLTNAGFEEFGQDGIPAGFKFEGAAGRCIFPDNEIKYAGQASLRFENFQDAQEADCRVTQEITVVPDRNYRLTCWIRAEGLDPSQPFGSGNVRVRAVAPDGRPLEWTNINAEAGSDWFQARLGFNSRGYDRAVIEVAAAEGNAGKVWVDELEVAEEGLVNVLRRPGTPLRVRGAESGIEYLEGQDYDPVADPQLSYRYDHPAPPIVIPAGSRIKEGEELRVSWYHPIPVYDGQVAICFSEPEIFEIWQRSVKLMHEAIAPKTYFLHMDEQRAGGTCEVCKARGISVAQMFGEAVTKAYQEIKAVNPAAEVAIWSDMLDPNHNARQDRPYYYHVDESFYGSWEYVPKDLIVACWWHEKRDTSLAFFDSLGMRTIGASYYDGDDLENITDWIGSLEQTPNAKGIIYTTWLHKYDLLDDYGDLVTQRWGKL